MKTTSMNQGNTQNFSLSKINTQKLTDVQCSCPAGHLSLLFSQKGCCVVVNSLVAERAVKGLSPVSAGCKFEPHDREFRSLGRTVKSPVFVLGRRRKRFLPNVWRGSPTVCQTFFKALAVTYTTEISSTLTLNNNQTSKTSPCFQVEILLK